MMGRRGSGLARLQAVAAIIAVQFLLAAMLIALLAPAQAGTETGEFCPTCPDWTNLDGWLAKKDAYERAQQNGGNSVQKPAESVQVEKAPPSYPLPEILTHVGAFPDGWVLLDARSPRDYERGHIPEARSLYWRDTQADDILNPALAESLLRGAGVNNSDKLLIYGDDDEGAAYLFWALSYLGHKNLSLLDGGVNAAWVTGIVPDTSRPAFQSSNYTIRINPWLLVNQSSLEALLNLSGMQILDARDFADYGRAKLTHAIPFEADKIYNDQKIKDAATLKDLLERRGLDKNSTQLVYGTPEAYNLFYGLLLMGYNATLLEGDWWQETEWAMSNIR